MFTKSYNVTTYVPRVIKDAPQHRNSQLFLYHFSGVSFLNLVNMNPNMNVRIIAVANKYIHKYFILSTGILTIPDKSPAPIKNMNGLSHVLGEYASVIVMMMGTVSIAMKSCPTVNM